MCLFVFFCGQTHGLSRTGTDVHGQGTQRRTAPRSKLTPKRSFRGRERELQTRSGEWENIERPTSNAEHRMKGRDTLKRELRTMKRELQTRMGQLPAFHFRYVSY